MKHPRFSIRPATLRDAGAVLRVHRRAILGLAHGSYTEAELESWAHGLSQDFYREGIESACHFEVALDDGGEVTGFAATRDDEVWLVYIDPDWARRGIGRGLLRRAEAYLLETGHRDIWVQSSLNAAPFYAAEGYERQKIVDAATRGGATLKALRMTKILPQTE